MSVCLSVSVPSVCLSLNVCLSPYVCLSVYLSVYQSICLSVGVSLSVLSVCLSLIVCLSPSVRPSVYLSACLSVCFVRLSVSDGLSVSVRPSVCLCPTVCSSVRPSVYLSKCLFVCGFTGSQAYYELKGNEQDFQCVRTSDVCNGPAVTGRVAIVTDKDLAVISNSLCVGNDTKGFFVRLEVPVCERRFLLS